jgi:hypothetical protein
LQGISCLLLAIRRCADHLSSALLQGHDFEGGTFCFQSGAEPLQVQPSAGMLLIYTADDSNVHSVQEVTAGERSTLTMWFTLDPEHQEDKKVAPKLPVHAYCCCRCGTDVDTARVPCPIQSLSFVNQCDGVMSINECRLQSRS